MTAQHRAQGVPRGPYFHSAWRSRVLSSPPWSWARLRESSRFAVPRHGRLHEEKDYQPSWNETVPEVLRSARARRNGASSREVQVPPTRQRIRRRQAATTSPIDFPDGKATIPKPTPIARLSNSCSEPAERLRQTMQRLDIFDQHGSVKARFILLEHSCCRLACLSEVHHRRSPFSLICTITSSWSRRASATQLAASLVYEPRCLVTHYLLPSWRIPIGQSSKVGIG